MPILQNEPATVRGHVQKCVYLQENAYIYAVKKSQIIIIIMMKNMILTIVNIDM